ncbi:hypothetical protein M758_4G082700 [Ceratodon purpureus]|nr:hypothetical protein M758_4G082700 [Ceratodon purpureus]
MIHPEGFFFFMDTGKPDFICLIQCFFSAGVENNSQNFAECEFLISFGCFSSVFGSIWQDVANPAESRQAFFSRLQILPSYAGVYSLAGLCLKESGLRFITRPSTSWL